MEDIFHSDINPVLHTIFNTTGFRFIIDTGDFFEADHIYQDGGVTVA